MSCDFVRFLENVITRKAEETRDRKRSLDSFVCVSRKRFNAGKEAQ